MIAGRAHLGWSSTNSSRAPRHFTLIVAVSRRANRPCIAAKATGSLPGAMSKLGQNFNAAGIGLFMQILNGNKTLALPHLSVVDIRSVNWVALHSAGFKGVVFDKDNTLTEPFSQEVEPKLRSSLESCMEVFGGKLVMYSNSAGLKQYDPEGEEAAALEAALGIHVLRHSEKKPAGGSAELEEHFGCPAAQLIMVGDRYLTDVVFGNRHGMLTIRPAPLTTKGEPVGVVLARSIEDYFVGRWLGKGYQAPAHTAMSGTGEEVRAKFLLSVPNS